MKKILKFIIVIAVVGAGLFFLTKGWRQKVRKERNIEKIKEGWYLEVICEGPKSCDEVHIKNGKKIKTYKNSIKIRKAPGADPKIEVIGAAEKGDVYKVLGVDETDNTYLWYRIEYPDAENGEGYIGEHRSLEINSVKDHNGEIDISAPVVKFDEDEYHVSSIDDINYDHLTLWDDKPGYTVTHTVYIEEHPTDRPGPQYWIEYTITDKAGKSSSKLQRITFDYEPSKSQVKNFDTDYLR